MQAAKECICCGAPIAAKKGAIFAPFIAHRIFDYAKEIASQQPPFYTSSIHCDQCGAVFSEARFSDSEMAKIYTGYRNEEYAQTRSIFEPGYAEINKLIGDNPTENANRQAAMGAFLSKYISPENVKSILDYGGDKGQHIPQIYEGAKKYVYDVSGAQPVDDVEAIQDISSLGKVDFIIDRKSTRLNSSHT